MNKHVGRRGEEQSEENYHLLGRLLFSHSCHDSIWCLDSFSADGRWETLQRKSVILQKQWSSKLLENNHLQCQLIFLCMVLFLNKNQMKPYIFTHRRILLADDFLLVLSIYLSANRIQWFNNNIMILYFSHCHGQGFIPRQGTDPVTEGLTLSDPLWRSRTGSSRRTSSS